ncbi:MAG: DUF4173 domain-containing protein [Bacteroidales bacterium]|nr:DUF4173 domain-containing protein [Bacteroidales bacterium]
MKTRNMKTKMKFALLIIGTLLFNLLFWHEAIGLNALIFTTFILGTFFYLFPEFIKSKNAIIIASGTFISAVTVVYHASELAISVWIFSMVLLQAFMHFNKLRTVFYGLFSSVTTFFMSYQLIGQNVKLKSKSSFKLKTFFKYLKLTLLPILVVYIFYWIFKFANPIFDNLSNTFFINLNDWIIHLFKDVSFLQILFTFLGFIIMAWFIYKNKNDHIVHTEAKHTETILRKRKKSQMSKYLFENIGLRQLLKNEFRIGLMLIILVNALLLMINVIDISTIWFNFNYTPEFDLKQFVHEGTFLLILSILLSIGIMIWFFRRNLNFYKYKKKLQVLSYIWIAQNIILLISVVIRNMHYIEYFGLAYKRIGVFFFLALVVFGLISLYLKIKDIKSSFWLFKINTWALYIGFVLFAIPDWDIIIAKHNLTHPLRNNIETSFLLTFDDKVLPQIDQRKDILLQSKEYNTYRVFYETYENVYKGRVINFLKEYKDKSWLSWNYADAKAYEYYKLK